MGKKNKSYNRMFDETNVTPIDERELNPIEPAVTEPVETVMPELVVEETPKFVIGTVVDCNSLNVREHPDRKADVLTILMAGTDVQIAIDEKLAEWYHVYTATGLDGFCMKNYIALKE